MKDEQTIESRLIRLVTEYPCTGSGKDDFELHVPEKLTEHCYGTIIAHLKFRQKCMNQGFENLLELLELHRNATLAAEAIIDESRGEQGESNDD